MFEGVGAANLDDRVSAKSAGHFSSDRSPFWAREAVDGVRGAKSARPLELGVTAGGDDGAEPKDVGELEGKKRDAARALNEHRVSRGEVAQRDEGRPSREGCAREACSFKV